MQYFTALDLQQQWHMKLANLDKTPYLKETPRRQVGSLLMHSLDTHSQQGVVGSLPSPSFLVNGQELVTLDLNLAL